MLKLSMFKINKEKNEISPIEERTFQDEKLKERAHLQEWIAKSPNVFGEPLLIIQKEFAGFDKTKERLDLLALDKDGCLVIIENKIDDSGKDVVWQAIKYGAYCSTLTKSEIISIYQDYLGSKVDAKEKIAEFFDDDNIDELVLNTANSQRFILVAGDFRDEVASTALWLIGNEINVQCFKVSLFSLNEELLLNVSKIIPPPDAENYMIGLAEKNVEEKQTTKTVLAKKEFHLTFWKKTLDTFKEKNIGTFNNISPSKDAWVGVATGIPNCAYNLVFLKKGIRVEIYLNLSKEENEEIYDFIYEHKELLEENFGNKMIWERLDEGKTKCCRIHYSKEIYSYDEKNWDYIIEWFAEHFQKFEKSIKPIIAKHPLHK